jgi:hypothetical protein
MQEAIVGGQAHESRWSAQSLRSLRDLNHRFLDLAAIRGEWPGALVASLTATQREAVAFCPYSLFDLRFQDEDHWQRRLHHSPQWRVADEAVVDDATARFVRLALFYAWHLASSEILAAQLLLGMAANTAHAFARITVNQLPDLVASEASHLSARWSGCAAYWNSLLAAASCAQPKRLRRVQLHGLQLSAAARLPGA